MQNGKLELVEKILEKSRKLAHTIVLPEGDDIRMLLAARKATDDMLAKIILIDQDGNTASLAKQNNLSLDGIEIIRPSEYKDKDKLASVLLERRKSKGMTEEEAKKLSQNHLYFGDLLVQTGAAHGCLAGAVNSTGDVVKAALYCIGAKEGTVSSYFLMLIPNFRKGEEYSPFVFSDCGVVPFPTVEQHAAIATASADSFRKVVGGEPKVAFLSFSTKGSAKHENIDKTLAAMKLVKERCPDLKVDGEFQLDAAVIPEIGKKKAPGSDMAGEANVLIFPDLNAGNICYKATERFAKAVALGPILQGLNKPVNDLSRGCSADDIYKMIAITSVSA
ncbi:MAG: phosphate acetyltransferase [Fibrobacteres bacterium]|nr:phosphate acetyltransferase [Fibrobacterota bacterium]